MLLLFQNMPACTLAGEKRVSGGVNLVLGFTIFEGAKLSVLNSLKKMFIAVTLK